MTLQAKRDSKKIFNALLVAAALSLGCSTGASAQGNVKMFTGAPPPAEELANLLFPEPQQPRTRSIVFTNTRPAQKAPTERPEGFGFLINFGFNSAEIMTNSRPYLDQVGEMLNLDHVRGHKIVIEGHTDASGGAAYNRNLSEQRAEAVKSYLVAQHQIEAVRLVTFGKGESELLAGRKPRDPQNRRVQFQRTQP